MGGDWRLVYTGYDPASEGLREALCTLANGYLGTRGAAPESEADGTHYPGTYISGGYNRLRTEIAGQAVEIEDLVNMPNWLPVAIRVDGGHWLQPDRHETLDYEQILDLRRGMLERRYRIRDHQGRETRIVEKRIVHIYNRHLMALEIAVTPLNWSGHVEVRSGLDGRVENTGVERYRAFNSRHLRPLEARAEAEMLFLKMETAQSELRIAMAARTRILCDGQPMALAPALEQDDDWCAQVFATTLEQDRTMAVRKTATVFTSADTAISEPGDAACKLVTRAPDVPELFQSQATTWAHLWQRFDLHLASKTTPNGNDAQKVLRLHLFHLLQTVTSEDHAAKSCIPARGLHGEAYHGHVFWDELFVFPVLNLRDPEITRGLLSYRHRRLGEAKAAAREAGYRGAMYPWQSGSDGREETQALHLNPRSRRWLPDNSYLQRHVGTAVAYNMWQYYQATGDIHFLAHRAGEVILEIARFWASAATYNARHSRYEIAGVMGPDEYHDAYPGADRPGLLNNAYTNVMAVWVLCRALETLETVPEGHATRLRDLMGITDAELKEWDAISRKMRIPFHDRDIISQFEGYATLEEFDWAHYRDKYGDIQRLDRILEAEGDTPNRYKVSKQADVLMLFYLFSAEELAELFERLGYPFDPQSIPRTIEYYEDRTSHGSTLSRVVHAWVLARGDRSRSWQLFREALESDICDIQGGTTAEGIHVGAMAGTVDLIQRCYTGIELRRDALHLSPCLPDDLHRLSFRMTYRGQPLAVDLTAGRLALTAGRRPERPIHVKVRQEETTLAPGQTRLFEV
jgi:alpha,alpha-trehalase